MITSPNAPRLYRSLLGLLTALTLLSLAACSSDDNPLTPVIEEPSGWDDSWPAIPQVNEQTSPTDLPSESDAIVEIVPYSGRFAPALSGVRGTWEVSSPIAGYSINYTGWDHGLPSTIETIFGEFELNPMAGDPPLRFQLATNGFPSLVLLEGANMVVDFPIISYVWTAPGSIGSTELPIEFKLRNLPVPITSPSMKKERFWRRLNVTQNDQFKTLPAGGYFEVSTSYSSGGSNEESYEFSRSITAEAGGGYGAFNASVSVTLSETFGTSVTVTNDTTVTYTEGINAPEDHGIVITLWQLVDRFTYCHEDGSFFSLEGYEWPELKMEVPLTTQLVVVPNPYD